MRTESDRAFPRRQHRQPFAARRIILVAIAAAATAAIAIATTNAVAAAPTAPPGWKPGWLAPPATYLGRYNLTVAASASATADKGVQGQLILFLQVAFPGKPGVPSGIISLHDAKDTEVLYLTDLDHDGKRRVALVHGGAFVAPPTGTFTVSALGSGVLAATLKQRGLATKRLTFKRFSTTTQP